MRGMRAKGFCGGLALTLLAACGGGGGDEGSGVAGDVAAGDDLVCEGTTVASADLWDAAQEEGEVTLYTSHFEEAELALGEVFTADTGVDITVVRLPGTRLDERILSEAGADVLEADVIRQSDFQQNLDYHERGIVEAYMLPEELDAAIAEEWKDPDGRYYATLISLMGIIYNNQLVSEEEAPTSWEDLLDPKWQGQIAMPYAGIGGSGWSMALFQRQELGEDYWQQLAAQEPSILQSSSSIVEEVARGEYPIAINAVATSTASAISGAPVTVVYPEEGTPTFPYAVSKVAGSPHPNAAELYMNWVNSYCGLNAAVEAMATYTPHPDTPPPPGANDQPQPPFEEIDPWAPDAEDWQSLREDYIAEWNQIFGFTPE